MYIVVVMVQASHSNSFSPRRINWDTDDVDRFAERAELFLLSPLHALKLSQ